jgi:ATP-dependent Clp protease protease subunit
VIDQFHDWGLLPASNILTIFGEIDSLLTSEVIRNIILLSERGPDQPIVVYLNSEGGDWECGVAIYDLLNSIPNHVTIRVVGQAMSMASIILQAGDVREATPHSTIMIHDGTNSIETGAISFERWADHSRTIRSQMYEIYSSRTGLPVAHWRRRCSHDHILTASKAVDEKLIDRIIE